MDRWKGRVALVTGASAGIGAGLTRELVKYGVKVAACARTFQRLQDLKEELKGEPGEVLPIECDLRKEDDILAMFKIIKDTYGGVDICINNAGVARVASLMSGQTERWRNILEVNLLALCICTREALASMKERNIDDGHIIHIGSTSGYHVTDISFHHVYPAAKHAVRTLTEGLRRELNEVNSNIRVTLVSPGLTKTEMGESFFADEPELRKTFSEHIKTSVAMEVSDVASAVVYALASPEYVHVNEILMRPRGMKW